MNGADEHLAAQLDERGRELSARATARMFENPFWEDRFGSQGRSLVEENGSRALAVLAQSLRLGALQPSADDAGRWREKAIERGLCTRHLQEQLDRLGQAIGEMIVPDGDRITVLVDGMHAALGYPSGSAERVRGIEEDLTERALTEVERRSPQWKLWMSEDVRLRARADVLELLSYLADALHTRRPEVFVSHARWADGFYTRRGRPAGYLDALVAALDREAEELDAVARAEVARLLARARIVNGASLRLA